MNSRDAICDGGAHQVYGRSRANNDKINAAGPECARNYTDICTDVFFKGGVPVLSVAPGSSTSSSAFRLTPTVEALSGDGLFRAAERGDKLPSFGGVNLFDWDIVFSGVAPLLPVLPSARSFAAKDAEACISA